jgi:hypothetical protein
MDIKQLQQYLYNLANSLSLEDREILNARLKSLISVFPFNEYEYMLMFLLDKKKISFQEYEKLRNDYVAANKYLELYTFSPRILVKYGHTNISLI